MPKIIGREKYDIKKLVRAISQRNRQRIIELILSGTPVFINGKNILDDLPEEDKLFLTETITHLRTMKSQMKPGNDRLQLSEFLSQMQHFAHVHTPNSLAASSTPYQAIPKTPPAPGQPLTHTSVEQVQAPKRTI